METAEQPASSWDAAQANKDLLQTKSERGVLGKFSI
jgi:hypothetical protein